MDFEAVIGLEIHAQLNCPTKMFCDCPNSPDDPPNANTCPICLWLPGAVPGFSRAALEKAVLLCLGLNCEVQRKSAFDQKVYYYPDLPKGFQLSQFHWPLSRNGWLDIVGEDGQAKRLRIHKIHMEEDVAKLVHETEGRQRISLVDFNRAGAPLVEIVTEPDMRSPHDAMEFLKALRTQIRYVGSSECSMERGTMRVDANISIRPRGSDALNTKVEVKNMNSIRHVGDAIAYEIKRQTAQVAAGEEVVLHTRLWDPDKGVTSAMRGKFEGPCVPDPTVADIILEDAWIGEMKGRLPEMPGLKAERFVTELGLTRDEAALMSSELDVSKYFEAVVKEGVAPRTAAHWVAVTRGLSPDGGVSPDRLPPERLARVLSMLEKDDLTATSARAVITRLFETGGTPEHVVEQMGLTQVSDASETVALVDAVLAEHADAVANWRAGKENALGFLVGQAMRRSGGRANPKLLREEILKKLS